MATVHDRIKRVVADRLGVDEGQVIPEASFTDDLNADSLDLVELIMALEEEFSEGDQAFLLHCLTYSFETYISLCQIRSLSHLRSFSKLGFPRSNLFP